MRHEIEIAMRILLKSDTSIPPNGCIDRAMEILKGEPPKQNVIATLREVQRLLHVGNERVQELIRTGKLNRILGKNDRCLGVSRESLRRYLQGEFFVSLDKDEKDLETLHKDMDKDLIRHVQ